jgi:hypothetical protein
MWLRCKLKMWRPEIHGRYFVAGFGYMFVALMTASRHRLSIISVSGHSFVVLIILFGEMSKWSLVLNKTSYARQARID